MKVVAVLYPGGEAADNPEVLGCAENPLGLRELLEEAGHELISTTDREGGELEENLSDADVLITTPFWPVYVTKEMLGDAPNLKLILTAGVGSDHVDLGEVAERGITVAEITGSNTVSVAEHAVMQILALVRNFVPAYKDVVDGGWSIGEISVRSHDLEEKTVGVYGAGLDRATHRRPPEALRREDALLPSSQRVVKPRIIGAGEDPPRASVARVFPLRRPTA